MKEVQACFVNTDVTPIETEHVCFYVTKQLGQGDDSNVYFHLMEVVKETYPHPDCEGVVVFQYAIHDRQKTPVNNAEGFIGALWYAQLTTRIAARVMCNPG